jgi:prolipoprotein diacylglyceryltransferase
LYEALFCLFLFVLLLYLYSKKKSSLPNGQLFGLFVVLLFTQRILVEFTKENQVAFENNLPFNMGQLLSVPFIFLGAYVLYRSFNKPLTW